MLVESENYIFLLVMGRAAPNVPTEAMEGIWVIAARHISAMYRLRLKKRYCIIDYGYV